MPSRRQLLIAPALLGLPLASRGGVPEDLVHLQSGTLPILLTAPHGGRMAIPGVVPRTVPPGQPPGNLDYVTGFDAETDRIALGIAEQIKAMTRHDVYLVVARFDRKFIDANRPPRLAFDQPAAQPVYEFYHRAIQRTVDEIRARHPHRLLIDVHGQNKIPAALVRGTLNGRAVRDLVARGGVAAVTGPKGLFGQLERHGFRVFPDNSVPPTGRHEDAGFNGGFTVDSYGSHRPGGIDAVQFEFGTEYRRKAALERTIEAAARSIVAFRDAYLS